MLQVSVIIPAHNRPAYLREALQSVVSQEGATLDVIVIGDGAGDDVAAVAREFAGVRYVWQPQSGPNVARNHAMALARHDCIALLDDDDVWLPGKLRAQLEIFERHPEAAYVFSDFHILRAGQPLLPGGLSSWGIPEDEWRRILNDPIAPSMDTVIRKAEMAPPAAYRVDLYRALLEHPYVLPTTAIFRKSFLTADVRFVDADFTCGDWEFFARLSRRHPAIFMPVETACNRSHEQVGRLTRTPAAVQLRRRLEMIERVWADDREFLADPVHRELVQKTQFGCLLELAKHQLRDGDAAGVRESLARAGGLGRDVPVALRAAGTCAAIPGGLSCLRAADRLWGQARKLLGR